MKSKMKLLLHSQDLATLEKPKGTNRYVINPSEEMCRSTLTNPVRKTDKDDSISITNVMLSNRTLITCSCKDFKEKKECCHYDQMVEGNYEKIQHKYVTDDMIVIKNKVVNCDNCLYVREGKCWLCK